MPCLERSFPLIVLAPSMILRRKIVYMNKILFLQFKQMFFVVRTALRAALIIQREYLLGFSFDFHLTLVIDVFWVSNRLTKP